MPDTGPAGFCKGLRYFGFHCRRTTGSLLGGSCGVSCTALPEASDSGGAVPAAAVLFGVTARPLLPVDRSPDLGLGEAAAASAAAFAAVAFNFIDSESFADAIAAFANACDREPSALFGVVASVGAAAAGGIIWNGSLSTRTAVCPP